MLTAFLRGQQDAYTKPRPTDSLARHGGNSEPHPRYLWARPNGKKQLLNSTPHATPEGTVPLREDITPERWYASPREYEHAISKLKKNKADAGGWTTETAQSCMDHPHLKQVILAWIHTHAIATSGPARRRGLRRTHRLVCLDKGGGAIGPILIGMIW